MGFGKGTYVRKLRMIYFKMKIVLKYFMIFLYYESVFQPLEYKSQLAMFSLNKLYISVMF